MLGRTIAALSLVSLLVACASDPALDGEREQIAEPELAAGACFPGGSYCGGNKLVGDADTLYKCNPGGAPIVVQRCAGGCTISPGVNDACAGSVDETVNGHALSAGQRAMVAVIATDVVPRLPGSRAERVKMAAQGAWWALKEGTWERTAARAYRYSNCNSAAGDHLISPTQSCEPRRAWQVGIAAVQVPGRSVAELEALVPKLYPGRTANDLLADLAVKAELDDSDALAVIASTDSLRASWLLRVPAIGFQVVATTEVVPECIEGSLRWCYGTSWDETKQFAPTKSAALGAIRDLERILGALAP